jgi:NADH-quinone oxidoreductase subunit M
MAAFAQKDIKRIIAYSSLSHLGYCMLGLFSFTEEGVVGGMLQMISHGISTGMLFLMIGMIYERARTRDISEFGGLVRQMPIYSIFFVIAILSSVGLPGTNGFIGEFLILIGSIKSNFYLGGIAAIGVVLGALYLLYFVKRFLFGMSKTIQARPYQDLHFREIGILTPLVILIFWIGLYPNPLLEILKPSARVYLNSASIKAINERTNPIRDFAGLPISRVYTDYVTLGVPLDNYEIRLGRYVSGASIQNLLDKKETPVAPETQLQGIDQKIEQDFIQTKESQPEGQK